MTSSETPFITSKNSPITLINQSVWILADSLVQTSSSTASPVSMDTTSSLFVGNTSWILWASNTFVSMGFDCCILLTGALVMSATGVFSFVDNNCTSTSTFWRNGSVGDAVISGDGLFFERCNLLNGFMSFADGQPVNAIVDAFCGDHNCNTSFECYGPLVDNSVSCAVSASSGTAVCSCLAGGSGDLCLPAGASSAPQSTSTPTTTGSPVTLAPTMQPMTSAAPLTSSSAAPPQHSTNTFQPNTPSSRLPSTAAPTVGPAKYNRTHSTSKMGSSLSASTISFTASSHSISVLSSSYVPSGSARSSPILSASLTDTCNHVPSFANAALTLLKADGAALSFAEDNISSIIPVSSIASSSGMIVHVQATPGISFTTAGNATGTIGFSWVVDYVDVNGSAIVVVKGAMSGKSAGALTLVEPSTFTIELGVVVTGPCLPTSGRREHLAFSWLVQPVVPPAGWRVATMATFRASSVTSSFLGSPVAAMTIIGMISILSLDACLYSDVDPLDQSVSPIGIAAGPELGQYYRGGAIVALSLYSTLLFIGNLAAQVLHRALKISYTTAFAKLHFPSIGMVVVSLFGQGLASCGMSLVRLDANPGDLALGIASLLTCAALVAGACYLTTGDRVECSMIPQEEDAATGVPNFLHGFVRSATWNRHWKDTTESNYKRRHMMLIDDLRCPWWTSVELSACMIQGAVLGIRDNSLDMCRAQQWILVIHTAAMAVAVIYFRPCGAYFSNMFLLLSKIGAFLISLCILMNTLTMSDLFLSAANIVTSLSTLVGSCQSLVQVAMTFIPLFQKLRRKLLEVLRRRRKNSQTFVRLDSSTDAKRSSESGVYCELSEALDDRSSSSTRPVIKSPDEQEHFNPEKSSQRSTIRLGLVETGGEIDAHHVPDRRPGVAMAGAMFPKIEHGSSLIIPHHEGDAIQRRQQLLAGHAVLSNLIAAANPNSSLSIAQRLAHLISAASATRLCADEENRNGYCNSAATASPY